MGWKEYRDTARAGMQLRKAAASMELNLVEDMQSKMKRFYRLISGKRMTGENVEEDAWV